MKFSHHSIMSIFSFKLTFLCIAAVYLIASVPAVPLLNDNCKGDNACANAGILTNPLGGGILSGGSSVGGTSKSKP
ncbi:uncharacterized protein B0P05DRAFT_543506 [Gilbertella persicaria]|uniref:uncharacterized protein n=1 Tax=Gilbertella persicaria TaxID=101096 RepID=UPI00221EA8DF|nr:uncharacterized protein B0P05DRAFT_543506 [Gilbertella persicaria]KAI8077960.1 hypothetical protein B0P05DRAFT_543506 [Gilbertella persicaria]